MSMYLIMAPFVKIGSSPLSRQHEQTCTCNTEKRKTKREGRIVAILAVLTRREGGREL
jgi:hypothetical protein